MTTNCLRQYSSSSSGSPKIVARRPKKEGDEFSAYRHLCEVRMRRLERYKKAKSFCSLEDEAACSSSLQQQMSSAGSSGHESLRSTISSTIESIPPSGIDHCHSSSMSDSLPSQARSSDGSHRPASQVSSANSVVESQFEVLREKM
uniref:Uncharacterized protein n=1 Tax=Acrobeloides nanus TaxID=290746 RepID=A0A914CLN4_9BILA